MKPVIDGLEPPYYAVIFTSIRTDLEDAYDDTDQRLAKLVADQPGFLGFESARQEVGITVSYWSSLDAIADWRNQPEHRAAWQRGKEWYASYRVRICRVEREYGF